MKTLITILITAAIFSSCTTIRNGYSEGYYKLSIQKGVVIENCHHYLNRYRYTVKTLPSGMTFHFEEFDPVYKVGDTVKIDRHLDEQLFISR
jgi:hypothetical protein